MDQSITKKVLSERVADRLGVYRKDGPKYVDAVLAEIEEALLNGEKVDIYGFGQFEVVERSERIGYNPKTASKMIIKPKKTIRFKPGSALKDKL
jgi:DNA-binding protein HU-beta